MGHVGRDEGRIATVLVVCWLLLLVACVSTGPVQWILCGLAVLGMLGTLATAVIWPNSPQRLLVTVTDYRCERALVSLTGVLAVHGSEAVYRPEVRLELLDGRKRIVTAKSFWPTGQTRRHVQPGFVGKFAVSLPCDDDARLLEPRISCPEYQCTVTWAATAGGMQPASPLAGNGQLSGQMR